MLKQFSLYTLVGLVGAGINFFVMPVLSHYLDPVDYGLLSLFNTYVTILIPLLSISAYSLLSVDYYKEKDASVFASKFTSIQVIPLFTTALLAVFTWTTYARVSGWLELEGTGRHWGMLMLLVTILSIYYEQFIQFLVVQKKATSFAVYSLLRVGVEVGLTFYFVVVRHGGWEGRMYSWLISSGLLFLLGTRYFYREGLLSGKLRWAYIREGIAFGSPLVLHGIGKFVVNQSDRLFIIKMLPNGLREAGIYNIGYTVGSLVMIFVNAFGNFYTPFLMERLSSLTEQSKREVVRMTWIYLLACVVLLAGISVAAPILFQYFIDHKYLEGARYVFWVALGYCFWGVYILFSGVIFYYKRNRILGWLAVFNVATNALFNYFFVQYYGAIGAAYATALSFFLLMLIVVFISNRMSPMPWLKGLRKA